MEGSIPQGYKELIYSHKFGILKRKLLKQWETLPSEKSDVFGRRDPRFPATYYLHSKAKEQQKPLPKSNTVQYKNIILNV